MSFFIALVDKPQHGDYEWLPPNTVVYTPTVDFVGMDSFTFRSHDGQTLSNVSTDHPDGRPRPMMRPSPWRRPLSTTRNSNVVIDLFATDVERDTISYTLVSSPTHGLLSGYNRPS
jgi:hypothetical protein